MGAADPHSFAEFYEAHFDRVLGFVTRRVTDPHLAADLTADIFLAAIESADRYRPERATPIAWLFGIAHHVVAAHYRRRTTERHAISKFGGRRLLAADDIAELEQRIDANREARELLARLATLPARQRAVTELVGVDGLTTEEAAAALGIHPVTARVRLHRARRALRDRTPETTTREVMS